MRLRFLDLRTLCVVAACVLLACDDPSSVDTVAHMNLKSGDAQTGDALAALSLPLQVRVTNKRGDALDARDVNWVAGPGNGSTAPAVPATDGNGVATTTWTLGPILGTQQITANRSDCQDCNVPFTATAHAPAGSILVAVSSQQVTGGFGAPVQPAPSVKVQTAGGTPLVNARVSFTVGSGGGVIGGNPTVATDANGVATVGSWTVPNVVGGFTLTATSVDIPGSTVTFNASVTAGAATQLVRLSTDPQTASVGTAVPAPPSVKVLDALGHAVAQVPVTFAVTAGGGSIANVPAATDGSGVATLGTWTLGSTPGPNTVLVSAFLVPSVTFTATATAAITSSGILFVTDRDANDEVYLVQPDGSGAINLTHNAARDDDPRWSFDRSRIVFGSERADPTIPLELYVMNAGGGNPTRITTNAALEDQPTFSPDGLRIVYHGSTLGTNGIYSMLSAGSGVRFLQAAGDQPDWVPAGNRVLFRAAAGLSVVDPNCQAGAGATCPATPIVGTTAGDRSPVYSPNGAKIAFARGSGIWVMNADGSGQVQLTSQDEDWPTWSPDGTQIAFSSRRSGCTHWHIYRMNATVGAPAQQVTGGSCAPYDDTKPNWR